MGHLKQASMVVCLWLLLGGASVAAEHAEVRITRTDGTSDAVAGTPRILTVSGESSRSAHIYVKSRAAGAAPCASTSASDPGAAVNAFYGAAVEGAFVLQEVFTLDMPGTVLFCVWISQDPVTASVPFAQIVSFRAPMGHLAVSLLSTRPLLGEPIMLELKGSSEVPAYVYATVRQEGGSGCSDASSRQAEDTIAEEIPVYGAFSLRLSVVPSKAGQHLICAKLARSATDAVPFAGLESVAFDVSAPRTCLVPAVQRGSRPTRIRQRLRRSHCGVGRTVRAHSSTVRRGLVIRLTRRAGIRLAEGTPVGLIISSGPRTGRRNF